MMGTMHRESSTDDDDFNPYMDLPVTKLIALYDYNYKDDDGNVVTMTKGEEYHLLAKEGDWWEVIRDAGDSNELSFYVPANYVKIAGAKGPEPPPKRVSFGRRSEGNESGSESLNSSLTKDVVSSSNTTPEKYNANNSGSEVVNENSTHEMEPDYVNSDGFGYSYERKQSTSTFTSYGTSKTLPSTSNSSLIKSEGVRRSFSDEGDYVNLDKYRNNAGIPSERTDASGVSMFDVAVCFGKSLV